MSNLNLKAKGHKKKRKKTGIFAIVLVVLLVFETFTLSSILIEVDKDSNKENNSIDNSKIEIIEEVKEKIKKVNIIDTDSSTRPYAVMINCHNGALPQAGLDYAYIVYEIMVEGGITRMMALFKDVDIAKIGSIRSARTQYLDYVYENDAIYVHAGGAKDAIERINKEKISNIDVDGIYGFRDTSLDRNWEHKLFTSTDLLKKGSLNKSIRTTTEKSNLLNYQAEPIDMDKYNDLKKANNVSIKYSDYRTSNYNYDREKQIYLRSMNNTENIDLVTGEQYEVKNIIVYGIKYSSYTYNNYSLYQKIDNIGTGEGYYITNGYAIPIIWEKENKNSQTIYKVKETNEELVINDGNTYIQIYPINSGNLTIS